MGIYKGITNKELVRAYNSKRYSSTEKGIIGKELAKRSDKRIKFKRISQPVQPVRKRLELRDIL